MGVVCHCCGEKKPCKDTVKDHDNGGILVGICLECAKAVEIGRTQKYRGLLREIKMHLPILEKLFDNPHDFDKYSAGTGVATLNGLKAAIAKAEGREAR